MGDQRWPCQKPPWGHLTAINSSTGDIVWQAPLGFTEQLPEVKQNTGRPALAGTIVTAGGVLFIRRFRAFDSKTGKQLWVTKLARRGPDNLPGKEC
jgi:quinoprotein glucose dehydrogenase